MASSATNTSESEHWSKRRMTLDEFQYANPLPGARTELVDGRMIVRDPPKERHGQVTSRIMRHLFCYFDRTYASEAEAGSLLCNDVGILLRCDPPTVRAADLSYYAATRPARDRDQYSQEVPDMVLEVRSPTDRAGYFREKIDDWRRGGCRHIWVADPRKRTFAEFSGDVVTTLHEGYVFDGGPLFPGLNMDVASLFR
jgi:Uma2 family endonuclease